jgi:hypothetical protein
MQQIMCKESKFELICPPGQLIHIYAGINLFINKLTHWDII